MNKKIYSLLALPLLLVGCSKTKKYSIHNEFQTNYLESGDYNLALLYGSGDAEKSIPNPVILEDKKTSGKTTFTLYTDEECTNPVREIKSDTNTCEVYNLLLQTNYYYKVSCEGYESKVKSFVISDTKWRSLYVDGMSNFRDIGYLKTEIGEIVKPGMIYRSSTPVKNETQEPLITELGRKQVNELGIKSELDLRKTSDNEQGRIDHSYMGDEVTYYSRPMKTGGNYIKLNEKTMNEIFEIFSHEENYPIDIHCSIGTDRTGGICFLLEALLGVTREEITWDYLFSNFSNIGSTRSAGTIKDYVDLVSYSTGNNLQEKTYNYLTKTCKVDAEYLDKYIEIMTK